MEHEFKIIMKFSDEEVPSTSKIHVYLDNEVVGCIEELNFRASAKKFFPSIKITFPNLEGRESLTPIADAIKSFTDKIKNVAGVKIKFKELINKE